MRFLGLAWPASLLNWFAPLRGAGVPPFGLGLAACSVFGVGLAPFVFWGWVALPLFSFWGWLGPLHFLGLALRFLGLVGPPLVLGVSSSSMYDIC